MGTTPKKSDILCGRDKTCTAHEGNHRFYRFLELYRKPYQAAGSKFARMRITKEIVDLVKDSEIRFLRFSNASQQWEELPDHLARDKVSHALRRPPRKRSSIGIIESEIDSASAATPPPATTTTLKTNSHLSGAVDTLLHRKQSLFDKLQRCDQSQNPSHRTDDDVGNISQGGVSEEFPVSTSHMTRAVSLPHKSSTSFAGDMDQRRRTADDSSLMTPTMSRRIPRQWSSEPREMADHFEASEQAAQLLMAAGVSTSATAPSASTPLSSATSFALAAQAHAESFKRELFQRQQQKQGASARPMPNEKELYVRILKLKLFAQQQQQGASAHPMPIEKSASLLERVEALEREVFAQQQRRQQEATVQPISTEASAAAGVGASGAPPLPGAGYVHGKLVAIPPTMENQSPVAKKFAPEERIMLKSLVNKLLMEF